jgi:hypothetical protein
MGMWHSATAMQRLAAALLGLAMVAIAVTYTANQKSVAIQGPGALQAVGEGTAWLGVDQELWVLDRGGRRTAVRDARALGLSQAVSNIALAPANQALLTSRGDPFWRLVDRATLAPVRTIRPQWPAEFGDNFRRAIHLAVAPDGDVAVATGGGHAVLLFDGNGRFKARTVPSTYRFTNGLWWSPEGWWTTDTNRFALHLLDAQTLAVKTSVPLRAEPRGYPFLAEAQASQGLPLPGTQQAPLATLTRVGFLMEPGHAVDVFPDGSQVLFNKTPLAQLRDMSWFDGHLLLVDGASFTVQRFGPDRIAEGEFGDAAVRAELRRRLADREFWRTLGSRHALLVAALLLLAGIGAYARHKRLVALAVGAQREGGKVVPPAAPLRERALQRLWIYGVPVAARLLVIGLALLVLYPRLRSWTPGPAPTHLVREVSFLLSCVFASVLPVALWQQWRHHRLAAQLKYEPALNHRAIDWLQSHDDFDRVKLEGELPRESVYVGGWRPRWLLVTNRRVLLFAASARERRLQSEWPRRAITDARVPALSLWSAWLRTPPNLVLAFTTGTVLRLHCASGSAARRVADLLMSSPALPDPFLDLPASGAVAPRRWHEVLASLAVPGVGQWLQRRFATGTVLFTAATLSTLFLWAPVAWALHGPKMDVSGASVALAAAEWLLLVLAAGADAWRFSATRRPR